MWFLLLYITFLHSQHLKIHPPDTMRMAYSLAALFAPHIAGQNLSFDYVIAGGGTAGLVIANRLSEDPTTTVVVVEPGDDVRNYPDVQDLALTGINFNTSLDWKYNSTAQPQLGGRVLGYTAGRAIGGTSTINGTYTNKHGQLNKYLYKMLRNVLYKGE
jgi:hypothetical protein